ncbi:MAG TPA: CpsD/CapB family tyrosine-protein kinase [Acidobacteriaceae bacterium]|nr:CpsD/CapB family tyrosine-protein kinase [Acidobacteriaceae bacterium]
MSQIFDALQRSEAERSGKQAPVTAAATELLERAERQAASQWEAEIRDEDLSRPDPIQAELSQGLHGIPAEAQISAILRGGELSRDADRAKIFPQFQTLEASLAHQNRLVCLTDKESPAAEAFRLLGVRLRDLRKDRSLRKVLITSTVPQEGKSFAAANLACTLASGSERRTLLIDGDLRRPTQAQLFGLAPSAGICECLKEGRRLAEVIYRLDGPNLWILPAGTAPENPLDVMQSAKLPQLMEQLSAWFDWIIIDSPPVLPLADTSVWARVADGILLVTRQGTTEKRKLQRGLDALDHNKLIGALLNSSHVAADSDYYYYRHTPATSRGGSST